MIIIEKIYCNKNSKIYNTNKVKLTLIKISKIYPNKIVKIHNINKLKFIPIKS